MSNYEDEENDEYEDDEIESDDSEETSFYPNYSDGESEEEDEEIIDLEDIEIEFDNLTQEQQAWILSTEAVAEFGVKFAEYVKAINPEMWRRARDYALDYVEIDGVEFKFGDEDDNGKSKD
jgi:hypothetical protein